jgi:gluconate 5-dehydrogenase
VDADAGGVDAIVAAWPADILVGNVGTSRAALGDWIVYVDAILDTNLRSALFLAQAAGPMRRQGSGRIVFTSLITGIPVMPPSTPMSPPRPGSPADLLLAAELGPHGITCNCIAPGLSRPI